MLNKESLFYFDIHALVLFCMCNAFQIVKPATDYKSRFE